MKHREREQTFAISKFDGEMILVTLVTLAFDVAGIQHDRWLLRHD